MTYDSVFGVSPTARPRQSPVAAVISLGLALLGAVLVALPATRLIGLGVVVLLAVPAVIIWRRASGSVAFWLALSALGVLIAAFLAGFIVTLVSGVPEQTTPSAPPPELSAVSPDASKPITPEDSASAPLPDAAPPPAEIPPAPAPAPARAPNSAPEAGRTATAPSAQQPAPASEDDDERSPGSASGSGQDADDEDEEEEDVPSGPAVPGRPCEVGSFRPNPDGSLMVCGQPDGRGGYTWRRVERGESTGRWGNW